MRNYEDLVLEKLEINERRMFFAFKLMGDVTIEHVLYFHYYWLCASKEYKVD